MKSVVLTFLMFLLVFGALRLGLVSLFDGPWFLIATFAIFLIVIGVAVFMFGLPTKQDFKKALKLEDKEVDDEKDD